MFGRAIENVFFSNEGLVLGSGIAVTALCVNRLCISFISVGEFEEKLCKHLKWFRF